MARKGFSSQSQNMSKQCHDRLPAKKARTVKRETKGVWTHDELKTLSRGGDEAKSLRSSKEWRDGLTRQDKYEAKVAGRRTWTPPAQESLVEILGR